MPFYRIGPRQDGQEPAIYPLVSVAHDGSIVTYEASMSNAFNNRSDLTTPNIVIGNNIVNCSYMFNNCRNLNSTIIIPEQVENCCSMFNNCYRYCPNIVYIPNSVNDCSNMFRYCYSFKAEIFFNRNVNVPINTYSIVNRAGYANRINLHFSPVIENIIKAQSPVGSKVTWLDMEGGFYNSTYKIYCYNNYLV